jgi:hypothetical protein
MNLSELKGDMGLLQAVLGVQVNAHGMAKCPFHEDAQPSFNAKLIDDVARWKCFAGCGSGTIIDAAMLAYGVDTPKSALAQIEKRLGITLARDEDYVEPIIDRERAERLIRAAHDKLMSDFGIQESLLMGKRGIRDISVVERYRVGFLYGLTFREWRTWKLNAWVLPITDASGKVRAIRLHCEGQRPPKTAKCLWAPFGTYPESKPVYRTLTLWPPPEQWRGADRLYLVGGELKALAMIGAGMPATSMTAGESTHPGRHARRIADTQPGRVILSYDNDPAGRKWRDAWSEALSSLGVRVTAITYSAVRAEHTRPQTPPKPHPAARECTEPAPVPRAAESAPTRVQGDAGAAPDPETYAVVHVDALDIRYVVCTEGANVPRIRTRFPDLAVFTSDEAGALADAGDSLSTGEFQNLFQRVHALKMKTHGYILPANSDIYKQMMHPNDN